MTCQSFLISRAPTKGSILLKLCAHTSDIPSYACHESHRACYHGSWSTSIKVGCCGKANSSGGLVRRPLQHERDRAPRRGVAGFRQEVDCAVCEHRARGGCRPVRPSGQNHTRTAEARPGAHAQTEACQRTASGAQVNSGGHACLTYDGRSRCARSSDARVGSPALTAPNVGPASVCAR